MLRNPIIGLIKSIGTVEYKDGKLSAKINYEITDSLTSIDENAENPEYEIAKEDVESNNKQKKEFENGNVVQPLDDYFDEKLILKSTGSRNTYLRGLALNLHNDLEKILYENYLSAMNQSNSSVPFDLNNPRRPLITKILNFLYEQGIIDNVLYNRTKNIINLRNKIVHNLGVLSNETLSEYIVQTQLIIAEFSNILNPNKKKLDHKL